MLILNRYLKPVGRISVYHFYDEIYGITLCYDVYNPDIHEIYRILIDGDAQLKLKLCL